MIWDERKNKNKNKSKYIKRTSREKGYTRLKYIVIIKDNMRKMRKEDDHWGWASA